MRTRARNEPQAALRDVFDAPDEAEDGTSSVRANDGSVVSESESEPTRVRQDIDAGAALRTPSEQHASEHPTRVSAVEEVDDTAAPVSQALTSGLRIDGYLLGQCIGRGGMARVYQAEHEALRRQVALKVQSDSYAKDAASRERFLREARIAAAVKHPNVVNLFDIGVYRDVPYLVMELLEGVDLDAVLESRQPLGEDALMDLMIPLVAGLSTVHAAGIVHRDLKPANVFLAHGPHGATVPKLLDFGISKAEWPEHSKLTYASGTLLGTPCYMSPEGLRGEEMTAQSDQYSLGVIMYECATGTNPFEAATFAETVRRVTSGEYSAPSSRNPQLSRRFERVIERCMNLEPSQRFADMNELGRELLLLAGQRTRVTWSLSFGEASPLTLRQTQRFSAKLARQRETQELDRNVAPRRRLNLALALVVPLALVLAGLGRHASQGGPSPAAAGAVVGAAAPAAIVPAAPNIVEDALALKPRVKPAPKLAPPIAPAAGDEAEPASRASSDPSERSTPTNTVRESPAPSTTRRVSPRATQISKPPRKRPIGANSAPILD